MPLPILRIAKVLSQLTVLAPVATEGVDKIRKLVETIRKGDVSTTKQLDALREAIELQNSINKDVDMQLRLMQSVFDSLQRSLKILALITAATGFVAIIALVTAIFK